RVPPPCPAWAAGACPEPWPGLWPPAPWAREFRSPLPWSLTLVDRLAAAPAHARLAAVGQLREPGPRRLVAAAADGQHVGQRQRSLALDDAALPQLLRRTLVLLQHVDVLDHHPALAGQHAQHLAALAAFPARDDSDQVASLDVQPVHQMT